MPKVSALVSTYNSERFIRGCLDDLLSQSLFREGGLEIVVIVSGSEQGEEAVVLDYATRYSGIVLVKTPRESMYQAWNRGIERSSGEYLTNANTDDRHATDGIERLAILLDTQPGISLSYGDFYLSTESNQTFADNPKTQRYIYPRFFAPAAVLHYQFSPQPLWRRSVHSKIGPFSETLRTAGDYEFNLRFAETLRAEKVSGLPVGSYLMHGEALSFKDQTLKKETEALMQLYRREEKIEALYGNEGAANSTPSERAQVHVDLGLRALCYYPPWFNGASHQELFLALDCFSRALTIDPNSESAANNLIVTIALSGEIARASEFASRLKAELLSSAVAAANFRTINAASTSAEERLSLDFMPSGLKFPTQQELVELTQ